MDNKIAEVPFYAVEAMTDRLIKIIKWLVVVIVVLIILFFVNNIAWVYFFNQYDWETEEIILDGTEDGSANYVGGNGGIFNGNGNSQAQETEAQEEVTSGTLKSSKVSN